MVHFCLTVYFPTWCDIKVDHQIMHRSKHLFNLIQRNNSLSNEEIRDVALDAVQRNGYFTCPESLLIGMLGGSDKQIRSVIKVIALCTELVLSSTAEEKMKFINTYCANCCMKNIGLHIFCRLKTSRNKLSVFWMI